MAQQPFGSERGDDIPQPRLARRILVILLCAYTANGVINLTIDPGRGRALEVPSLICVAAVFLLQLLHISPGALDWPVRRKALSLGTQTVLTYVPFVFFHEAWGGMAGFVAGSFLLLLRGALAWALFWAVDLSMFFYAAHYLGGAGWISYYGIATMITGLVTFGMTRLAQLVTELYLMREEVARMAVTQERLRFARDLHDLLGYSLSSITLKSELTYRLVPKQPERAQQELTGILRIARQALADVRAVASSYRDMSLTAEVASAKSMLEAAGVATEVELDYTEPLPPRLDTVLATTLREGVTNILRHSKVQRCNIEAGTRDGVARLALANDGVAEQPPAVFAQRGSGLGNLTGRLAAFGGTLKAGVGPDGWFHLVAEVPLGDRAAGRRSAEAVPTRGGVHDGRDKDLVG